ncbi:MAG: FimB/Mfa2 family fimbrial subunit [Muribaculaceae bacterium]|nr:FimB/Mfa2 family fimbrial subunit [Muribaculaceae bacterium]
MKFKANLFNGLLGGALIALSAVGLSSCSLVKEDLAECPVVEMRFIYEYNMEFANAFHKQADCLDVYFYNSDGKLVDTRHITDKSLLSDENYRMTLELPGGAYHAVAYVGMGCEKTSFNHINQPAIGTHFTDLHVKLDHQALQDKSKARLHNHYYGSVDFTIDPDKSQLITCEMMRNTNSIQIALQHTTGEPIDVNDFNFAIIDDNDDFQHDNNLLTTGEITYIPWNTENRTTGLSDESHIWGYDQFHAALSNFTTSRLVYDKDTRTTLHITRADNGDTVLKVPLLNYILMFKNDRSGLNRDDMPDQEYLDRENSWNFVFFLDSDEMWVQTRIIVNDWEVRMNEAGF